MTERFEPENSNADLLKKLSFETLLSELSARFINLSIDKVDDIIEDAQQQICECLGFDLSTLWQKSAGETGRMVLTHLYSPPDGPKSTSEIIAEEAFPYSVRRVLGGYTVIIHTDELTKEESSRELESRLFYGVKSSVVIPLQAGSKPIIGILAFDTLREKLICDARTIHRLELVAQIFCNALARKKSEAQLREGELRLNLAADSAGAGLWEYNCHTRLFWATDQARKIFGYTRDELISQKRFESSILPEDLALVQRAINDAFQLTKPLDVEYRIFDESRQVKWVCSSGRPFFGRDGKPERLLGVSLDIHRRKCLEEDLRARLKEVETLKRRLEGENYYLREDLVREQGFEQIIGCSKALKTVLSAARQVAMTDASVLLLGETGTGKGLLAHAIHKMSARKDYSLVTVNCAALPSNLIESELFGREKGAFTGAHARQAGRFEIADHGTIFLDEIGEMPLELQAKLLRVLQDGEFERLGGTKTIKVDVRVIAATAQDLRSAVRNGRFREDLFYRINVFPITMPPLRERTEDIVPLTQYLVEKFARKMNKKIESIPNAILARLLQYDWPGNVRELEHLIERSIIISSGSTLTLGNDWASLPKAGSDGETALDLVSVERQHIIKVLRRTSWRIEGNGGAAAILDIHPSTLRFKLKKMGIRRPV
jgi:PAS domain S-box-containing protein